MRRLLPGVFVASICIIAVVASPAEAQRAPDQHAAKWTKLAISDVESHWPKLSARQKMSVLHGLIKGGQFDLTERLLGKTKFRRGAAIDAQFLTGLLRKAQGRHDEAVDIFRTLLASYPKHETARLELAHTLFLVQHDDAARHHFNLALGAVGDQAVQTKVRRFIDALDRRKHWHLTGYFSLAPSTNINQGTDTQVVILNGLPFTLDKDTRRKSGIGVNSGIAGGYRFAMTDKLDLVVGGGGHLKKYENKRYDDTSLTAELGPRYRMSFGDVAIYGTVTRRWYGHKPYAWYRGGRLQTSMRLGKRNISRATTSCLHKKHEKHTYKDGWNCSVAVEHDYFTSSSSFFRALGGYQFDAPKVEHLRYKAYNVGAGAYYELPFGSTLYGQVMYTNYDFDGLSAGYT